MSLKAKLEAVIYAAEEPVTLVQLAALFATDALEWKAEQRRALGEDEPAAERPAEVQETLPELVPEPEADATDADAGGAADEAGEVASEPAADPDAEKKAEESELKKQAKLRDKEVREILKEIIASIAKDYQSEERGIEVREIAGGYRMATKPQHHDGVRAFIKSLKPALKLSLPALETLAVIAYKQPVTAPEVSEIRGVDTSGVLGSLMGRKLITTAGRKQVLGRPILYKTTKEFLLRFGLSDISELPSMEEFEKLAAIEFEEPMAESPAPSALEEAAEQDSNRPEFEEDADENTLAEGENVEQAEGADVAPVAAKEVTPSAE